MAFYGCYFSFDGIPCTEFGLMMYDFGASNSGEVSDTLSPAIQIVEERIARRNTPLHYGVTAQEPLKFTMTFGASIHSIDRGVAFDRWDMDEIARWLTGHDGYRWLEIEQSDMEPFRYRCIISDLQHIDIGKTPWGFSCTVICDSPYGYLYPEVYTKVVNGSAELKIQNKSSAIRPYRPNIFLSASGFFTIRNETDGGRETKFTSIPGPASNIQIDGENEIITCKELQNPYSHFNFNFLRLVRGTNHLLLQGYGTVRITCEFPVRIGG